MATGLIPHYAVTFDLEGLTREQFLVLAARVAGELSWELSDRGSDGFVAYTAFSKRSFNERIRLHVDGGLVTLTSESQGGQFIDWGRNKRNVEAFISHYDGLRSVLKPEELIAGPGELDPAHTINQDRDLPGSSGTEVSPGTKGFLSLFLPTRGYCVTPILIDLNILVFVLMVASGVHFLLPDAENLLAWGANFRPYTLEGQSWRLLTNCFLHIGILHLLFNMYALLYIGILLEPKLGSWKFGIAYIVTGLLASITSLYWHPMTVSAGASGAIFGMYGVFFAMLTTNLVEKKVRKALLSSIAIFIGYNLLYGLKGGIDNAAHLGGLVSGVLIGYSFYPGLAGMQDKKLNYGLPSLIIIALLGFSSRVYKSIPNDIARYDERMKSFFSMESQALEVFKMPAGTPKEELLTEIKDRSLYYWAEDKKLVTELDKLDLPPEIHSRNSKLIRYCDLRIASYGLIYKAIAEGTRIHTTTS
jgi:rhomboid protease GluP